MPDATTNLTRTVEGQDVPLPGTYAIDPAHSSVSFVARHLVVSKVRGQFGSFSGTIVVADDPAASSVEVTIEAGSVSTNEPQRDAHLRSPDFFDAERFPAITFSSTGLHHLKGERWQVTGDLTIRGTRLPVELDVEFNGASGDPWGGARLGFSATTEIDREAFGLTWNQALETGGVLVGRTVKVELDVEAIRA